LSQYGIIACAEMVKRGCWTLRLAYKMLLHTLG
jgi:hypothetical protein